MTWYPIVRPIRFELCRLEFRFKNLNKYFLEISDWKKNIKPHQIIEIMLKYYELSSRIQ
jgi:hypothetical protein